MRSNISIALVFGAITIVTIGCTVKSIIELYKQYIERFTYVINGFNVVFHAFIGQNGSIVYDVYVQGKCVKTTKPRFNVILRSSHEEAFRHRLAHMLVKTRNKKVSFSRFKMVNDSIVNTDGTIVFHGAPYYLHAKESVLNKR